MFSAGMRHLRPALRLRLRQQGGGRLLQEPRRSGRPQPATRPGIRLRPEWGEYEPLGV